MRTAFEKNLRHIFLFFLFWLFLSKILSHRSRLSQTTSDPAQNIRKFQSKIAFFCFSGEHFGTILSRRSRLSRTSRAPSRLIRPRPIVCDAGHDRHTMISRFLRKSIKKVFFRARHLFLIFTPKEAYYSRIFVTGGSVTA